MSAHASHSSPLDPIAAELLSWPQVEFRAYFGGVFLVRGRMFAWVGDKGTVVLKLPGDRYEAALAVPGAIPVEVRPGISFGKWVRLPLNDADPADLLPSARTGYQHVLAEPPKSRRKRRGNP